jgi:ribonuclease-3
VLNDPTGPAHAQRFEIDCYIDDLVIKTEGHGSSRRAAEQEAAKAALEQIALQQG